MEWQLIETAPKDGRRILVTVSGPINYYPETVHFDINLSKWIKYITDFGRRVYLTIEPTHWMDLPNSPTE